MRALAQACARGEVCAEVALVVAPKADLPAFEAAQGLVLPVALVSPESEAYGRELAEALAQARCDWVCLAGYLRLLPGEVLEAFPGRILNIHPALLPKFGGKGMYGLRVHEAVIAAGETESGCTVHYVNERYDEGKIVLQLTCPVLPNDTPETLAARVLQLEHRAYPEALRRLIAGEALFESRQ
jgi:phosphoribosylglycinamide formyltransferase 1